jgi:hypothetical protein
MKSDNFLDSAIFSELMSEISLKSPDILQRLPEKIQNGKKGRYLQQLYKHSENFKRVSAQNQSLIIPAETDLMH